MTQQQNQREFELSLTDFEHAITENVKKLRDDMATEAQRIIIEQTPVKTGAARGNIVLTVGEPTSRFDASRRDPSGATALVEGQALLVDSDPLAKVYINATAYYLRFLNDGTKKMRGRHMIEQAIERVSRMFGG